MYVATYISGSRFKHGKKREGPVTELDYWAVSPNAVPLIWNQCYRECQGVRRGVHLRCATPARVAHSCLCQRVCQRECICGVRVLHCVRDFGASPSRLLEAAVSLKECTVTLYCLRSLLAARPAAGGSMVAVPASGTGQAHAPQQHTVTKQRQEHKQRHRQSGT